MNRKTLDVAVPVIYGVTVAVLAILGSGAMVLFTVIGGAAVGLYFAALRQNLPAGPES